MLDHSVDKNEAFISVIMIASELFQHKGIASIQAAHQYLEDNFADYEIIVIEDKPHTFDSDQLNQFLKKVEQ